MAGFWMGEVAQHGGVSRFGMRRNLGTLSTNERWVTRVGCIMRHFLILLALGKALASSWEEDEHVEFRVSQQLVRRMFDALGRAIVGLEIKMAAFPASTSFLEPPQGPNAPRYHTMVQSNVMPAAGNGKMVRVCQRSTSPSCPSMHWIVLRDGKIIPFKRRRSRRVVMHYLKAFPGN